MEYNYRYHRRNTGETSFCNHWYSRKRMDQFCNRCMRTYFPDKKGCKIYKIIDCRSKKASSSVCMQSRSFLYYMICFIGFNDNIFR